MHDERNTGRRGGDTYIRWFRDNETRKKKLGTKSRISENQKWGKKDRWKGRDEGRKRNEKRSDGRGKFVGHFNTNSSCGSEWHHFGELQYIHEIHLSTVDSIKGQDIPKDGCITLPFLIPKSKDTVK